MQILPGLRVPHKGELGIADRDSFFRSLADDDSRRVVVAADVTQSWGSQRRGCPCHVAEITPCVRHLSTGSAGPPTWGIQDLKHQALAWEHGLVDACLRAQRWTPRPESDCLDRRPG